jgi:hypothetical protein
MKMERILVNRDIESLRWSRAISGGHIKGEACAQ